MKKGLLIGITCFGLVVQAFSQIPSIQWQKTYGGTSNETAYDICRMADGGFTVVGSASSQDGDIVAWHGQSDYWIVRTDSLGALLWTLPFGGNGDENASSVIEDSHGNVVVAGGSAATNGLFTGYHGGGGDYGIVKVDAAGQAIWEQMLGGTGYDYASAIHETADGGFILGGYSDSNDGDVSNTNGGSEFWVVKIDSAGAILWQKSYGGSLGEYANDLIITSDGGFILAGTASSNDGDVTGNHGMQDAWIVKLSSTGTIEWQQSYGGTLNDRAYSIKELSGGGYVFAGFSASSDGDLTNNNGGLDYWVVKLDNTGNIIWQKELGGILDDRASSILVTTDGGYLVSGTSSSSDGDISLNHGADDIWIVKIDDTPTILWEKSLGGTSVDGHHATTTTTDGKYVLAGYANSNDGDVTGNHSGQADFWVVKLATVATNVSDLNIKNNLEVYPNPTDAFVTLNIRPELLGSTYSLIDAMGRQLLTGQLRSERSKIDMEQLPAGYYILKLNGKVSQSIKLIKR